MLNFNFIDIHTHRQEPINDTIQIINLFPNEVEEIDNHPKLFYSLGIHPWNINKNYVEEDIKIIKEFSENKKVLAIGEIGLDRISNIQLDIQTEIFIRQLTIAEICEKPVIIHCVKAFSELISIKKTTKSKIPWIIHGFNQNEQILNELIKNSIYISLGHHLTIDNSNAQNAINKIPKELLFFETDENEEAIWKLYNIAAEKLEIELAELQNQIKSNFKNLFKF